MGRHFVFEERSNGPREEFVVYRVFLDVINIC